MTPTSHRASEIWDALHREHPASGIGDLPIEKSFDYGPKQIFEAALTAQANEIWEEAAKIAETRFPDVRPEYNRVAAALRARKGP